MKKKVRYDPKTIKSIRDAIKPKGYALIIPDYCQQEMRVIAEIKKDMSNAYNLP
jgi:DNA polymerase I-like protein with 3'-5' exonuclease and polymerase domains